MAVLFLYWSVLELLGEAVLLKLTTDVWLFGGWLLRALFASAVDGGAAVVAIVVVVVANVGLAAAVVSVSLERYPLRAL